MKERFFLLALTLISMIHLGHGQESPATLENQVIQIIESSNRYQDYKVIKLSKLNLLQKNVADSVAAFKSTVEENLARIGALEFTIDSLVQNEKGLSADLALAKKKEDGMIVFGNIVNKGTYQIVVWSIIGILVLMVLILFFKFKSSNAITKESNTKLQEIEAEFETHRQKTLEREQQLRRKLQDEINKQKEGL